MATATVRTPGQAQTAPAHRRVVLKAGSAAFTLPITSPEVTHTDLTPEYVQIPRIGQRPLLRQGGDRLRQMQMTVTMVNGGHGVEGGLAVFGRWSRFVTPLFRSRTI
jgi:hypothetical protein